MFGKLYVKLDFQCWHHESSTIESSSLTATVSVCFADRFHFSRVDPKSPTAASDFPLFAGATPITVTLTAGEVRRPVVAMLIERGSSSLWPARVR